MIRHMNDLIPSRKRVYDGLKFNVDLLETTPSRGTTSGKTHRDIVIHPGSTIILPLLSPDEVILIRVMRYAVEKELWELPAGTLDHREDPAVCAARELTEETGYIAADIRPLCRFYTCPGISTELMHAFVATDLKHVGQKLQEDERIDVHTVRMDESLNMIRNGEIQDAKTIAAILHYRYLTN